MQGKVGAKVEFEGQPMQSCIHCHQVRDAQRRELRAARQSFPDDVLFPWPLPDVVGLKLDPQEKARVIQVAGGSQAEKDGFKSGDHILSLNGQPILSIADVQWVMHTSREPAKISALVRRGGGQASLTLSLNPGWRKPSDIGWRPTSWELRLLAA
jgi:S1-C subfamily serine protease